MRKPEEIEDREAEVAVARVAAVDVAKASGVVCSPSVRGRFDDHHAEMASMARRSRPAGRTTPAACPIRRAWPATPHRACR